MKEQERKLELTDDGSHTVSVPGLNLTFHSRHGAIQESQHVFIDAGLHYVQNKFPATELNILEIGFGTGLNAFLTAIESTKEMLTVHYTSIDSYPLDETMVAALNYPSQLGYDELFHSIQRSPWNTTISIHKHFSLRKELTALSDFKSEDCFHLIYFDAFAPDAQPELWTEEVFRQLADCMHPGGALVTYCSKGNVRRTMQAAGWTVTKIPGPKGKREMVRALWQPESN